MSAHYIQLGGALLAFSLAAFDGDCCPASPFFPYRSQCLWDASSITRLHVHPRTFMVDASPRTSHDNICSSSLFIAISRPRLTLPQSIVIESSHILFEGQRLQEDKQTKRTWLQSTLHRRYPRGKLSSPTLFIEPVHASTHLRLLQV